MNKQLMVLGALTASVFGAVAMQACSSNDDNAVATADSGADSGVVDSGVVITEDSGVSTTCYSCAVMIDALRRPSGQISACADNGDGGKSSKQLLDEAFACACQEKCAAECTDTCNSAAEIGPACAVCAGTKCSALYSACRADDPERANQDSGATMEDSGTDAATANDAAVADAGADAP